MDGLKPIEQVKNNDYVLTHKNRYQKVLQTIESKRQGICTIKVQGANITECTLDHYFYIRRRSRVWNNKKRNYDVIYREPYWECADKLQHGDLVAFPRNIDSINEYNLSDEEIWLIGRYVADGYLQDYQRKDRLSRTQCVVFCIGKHKEEEFNNHVENINMRIFESRTTNNHITSNQRLFYFCNKCGRHAENKIVPTFIKKLPIDKLEVFLDGYMSGDGSYEKKTDMYRAGSVSKKLIFDLAECVNKIYNTSYSINLFKREPTCIIEGRIVNQKDIWSLRYKKNVRKQDSGKFIDDMLWMPVRSINFNFNRTEIVYNIKIDVDNTYVANGMAACGC